MTFIDARQIPDFESRFASEIEEVQRLRGWIANSYAQIEFMLGDLILRSQHFAEYSNLPCSLPHGAPDRIKRVQKILKLGGAFAPFSESLENILIQFESKHETRNLLAHGFCEFLFTPNGDTGIRFQKWHRVPGREDARLIRCFRLADLEAEQETLTALAQKAIHLFHSIHQHFGWVARPDL